jgi:hypothetical protein
VTKALSLIYTLNSSLQHAPSLLSLLYLHQWMFSRSRAHVHAGWRPSHTNLLLFSLPSQRLPRNRSCFSLYRLGTDNTENTSRNKSVIVVSRSYSTDRVDNTTSQLLHCCVLRNCRLATCVSAEPFPSNGGLCWLHSSLFLSLP